MSFSAFAVNEINNCHTRRAKVRQSPKQDWFYIFSHIQDQFHCW